jgi:NADH:ubiquinone oxidoreductase subunit 6 (subunit J)
MYLIITALAAVITTVVWYKKRADDKHRLGTLCLMYWGATMMWLVDCIAVIIAGEEEIIDTSLDATLLGVSVVVLGLIIWFVIRFIKYYKNKTQKTATLHKSSKNGQ